MLYGEIMMKKIFLVGEFDKFGGTRTYFKQILKFYLGQGFDVKVGIPVAQFNFANIESLPCKYVVIPDCPSQSGLNFILKRYPFNALLEWLCIRRIYTDQRPDLLVISTGTPWKYMGLFLFPRRSLYILHTYPHSQNGEFVESRYLKKYILGLFLSRKKQIMTVSAFAQMAIAKCMLLPDKHRFVRFIPNTAGARLKLQVKRYESKKKLKILTLGHVTWYKNPAIWLEVAKLVLAERSEGDIQFIWAGDGDMYLQCQNWVAENNLEKSIKFVGFESNVDQLYLDSDIYFQPSIIESQGLSVIEAMRYGLPCVVSNMGGLPESVLDNKTGFIVEIHETNKMAAKILQLIRSFKLREKFGIAGQHYYSEHFSENLWEDKMIALHQELLT